jgi:nicotinamide riboside kinase
LGKSSSSHGVITKWVVFTGTYSAGKTTLVQDLAKSLQVDFHQEPAREFIEEQLQLGRTRVEIWADIESGNLGTPYLFLSLLEPDIVIF